MNEELVEVYAVSTVVNYPRCSTVQYKRQDGSFSLDYPSIECLYFQKPDIKKYETLHVYPILGSKLQFLQQKKPIIYDKGGITNPENYLRIEFNYFQRETYSLIPCKHVVGIIPYVYIFPRVVVSLSSDSGSVICADCVKEAI